MTAPSLPVRWAWLFLDTPRADADASLAFWSAVSATMPSPWRGDHDEFTTLTPADGPAWLKFQRVEDGPGGVHLDLDVPDPQAAAAAAVTHGATVVADHGYVVLRSPGGFTFCLTPWSGAAGRPREGGATSLVDQVCLDIPADKVTDEVACWAGVTGWRSGRSTVREEFHWAASPDLPVRLLFQRLDDPGPGEVTGHVDVACADREETVAEHLALGASVEAPMPFWTVMRDPTGRRYCLTDRSPATGSL